MRAAGRERPPWDGTGGVRGAALSGWPGRVDEVGDRLLTLFLCGDVMTGRGVDQVLPHPGGPELREPHVGDAREYVRLAERASGRIPRRAGFSWPWGDALRIIDNLAPDVRVINLETSITRSSRFAPGKAVHYRMSPGNVPCVAAARPDACALANNHVLDFGRRGLADTLDALSGAGLRAVGAGRDAAEARRPVAVPVPGGRRVVIFSCGTGSSGIPAGWAAAPGRPGIDLLPDLSGATADDVADRAQAVKRPGDVVVVSIHWGSNWGYDVDPDQVRFARRLVDGGVDLVHGHSSHHPRLRVAAAGHRHAGGAADGGRAGQENAAAPRPGGGRAVAGGGAGAGQPPLRVPGRSASGWPAGPASRSVMSRAASAGDLVAAARAHGVSDERVLEAISVTPRAGYVPGGHLAAAYRDVPVPIGHGQVTTQPSLSARMIEGLRLAGGDHVLEIGTGLGFQTALLARLAAAVVSIERWPDLAGQARRNLARHGIRNAEVLAGDGSRGLPDRAPYDAILVSAAFPEVPAPLAAQLRVGGRLVQPIGPGGEEEVVLFERSAAGLQRRQVLTLARFVRLHGRYGFPSRS